MPLRLSRGAAEPTTRRAVVGAARKINLGRRSEVEKLRLRHASPWQRIAWRHYDAIGEVKFAYNYLANAMSRCRMYAAYIPDDRDGAPVPIGSVGGLDRDLVTAARYEVAKLDAANGGQSGILRAYSLNRSVAGEMYLAEVEGQLGIYSTEEVQVLGTTTGEGGEAKSGVRITPRRDLQSVEWIDLPQNAYIARIWTPHPGFSDEADSTLLGVRDSCEELIMLSRMIRASAMSQLNNGILYVADELRFERAEDVGKDPDPDDPNNPDQGEQDPFEEELAIYLAEPVDDELSSATVNPLVVRGPADMAETAIKKIDLSRPFDKTVIELRTSALDRVLNGIDIPKDLVSGMSGVRYSNAQQISEDLYKIHIEPGLVSFCEAYTTVRLRAALVARGFSPEQIARVTTWYDASEVTTNANRSKDADSGHDRLLISDATWRRDHGYTDADAPNEDELLRRQAMKSNMAPETMIQMLAALIPLVGEMARDKQISLTPMSMQPQRPPVNKQAEAQSQILDIGGQMETPQLPPGRGGRGGSSGAAPAPAPSGGAPPPPEGTPAPTSPSPVNAAARPRIDSDLTQLLAIERRLRAQLQTLFTDATERALERAGSRIVSKIQHKPDLRNKVKDVPPQAVAASLGRPAVVAAGFQDQQLVNDSIDQTEAKYKRYVGEAQAQAAKIIGSPIFTAADLAHSWSILKPALTAYALHALFRKENKGYVPKLPMEHVRSALAHAGGGGASATGGGVPAGAVFNDAAFDALAQKHDMSREGYRWVYGISENEFIPHLELDGREFADWSDEALRNPDTFPNTTHYYPGDHKGCECDVMPMFLPVQPHEGRNPAHRDSVADITHPSVAASA